MDFPLSKLVPSEASGCNDAGEARVGGKPRLGEDMSVAPVFSGFFLAFFWRLKS